MKKHLAFYETEWPANIAELTAVENKPFVGYLKGEGVLFTVIPKPVVGPADNEIWYTSSDGNIVPPQTSDVFGANIVSNTYENGKGIIKFDNSITSVGNIAFAGRNSLTSITIPNNITSIGDWAFANCTSLTSITIPNSVTSIGSSAFEYCSSLTSVTIGNSVTSIGECAFKYCSKLTSITIPNSVTSIGEGAFDSCTSLTSITILNSVTSIGNYAFWNCSSLTSVAIPNGVTSIGDSVFAYCSSLTSVTFEGTMEEWRAIEKNQQWDSYSVITTIHCVDGDIPTDVIDLGLSVLWRKMNIDATDSRPFGKTCQWGETEFFDATSDDTYKHYDSNTSSMTKYTPQDGLTTLLSEDDIATAVLGTGYRIPTYNEWKELRLNCTITPGNGCMVFTSKINNNRLTLPFGGAVNERVEFWSSLLNESNSTRAYAYNLGHMEEGGFFEGIYELDRMQSAYIRPVYDATLL